ncbi:MAG TPA: acryloyl-CoA reductase [Steroidobacteraceae bacterium]|nr:acryloyl-CoA reductase [Steroidobacteraceae bacterium]
MSGSFSALRIHQRAGRVEARLESLALADLSAGDVLIRVAYSGINYKDALAASGAGRILRRYPLIGGIDLAGTVEQSQVPEYRPGDAVLVTGCGLSETRDGGYAAFARVPAEAVVPMPAGLTAASSMAIGTAGFAAARAVMRMQANGQTPSLGPVVVTGASGGVGSLAIDLLAGLGYEVVAVSGKRAAQDYLRELGAAHVLLREELVLGTQPLESARWGGAIDNVGGETLSWLLRSTREQGNVAAVGMAASAQLASSIMPFILRGVSLLGVNSASLPRAPRLATWARLATDLKPRHLERIAARQVGLAQLPGEFADYLAGRVTGRTLVRLGPGE